MIKNAFWTLASTALILALTFVSSSNTRAATVDILPKGATRLLPKDAEISSATSEVVADDRIENEQGITLKAGIPGDVEDAQREPDLKFQVKASSPGLYQISTFAVVDDEGAQLMAKAKGKYESLFLKLQFDQQRPTKRVVYVPWNRPLQVTGKFPLNGEVEELKIWLPRGVRLGYVELRPYSPPAVPKEAQNYRPKWTPPAGHPRLWCNQETLPLVRDRLKSAEHRKPWEQVTKEAQTPFEFKFTPGEEVSHNAALEKAVTAKAFYHLMTGDEKIGREAVELMDAYLAHVEFGNILDITREIGAAIYTGSLVYDWCNTLLTEEEKERYYQHLMRLALDMECGWPPFRQSPVNGHGAEAQINRDLLSMGIALFDRDPLPYQYTSYAILEVLVPMRNFEYQSPRYNQGVSYGAYRFNWEMHAAWFFYRMTGEPAFDDNIKGVRKYFQYMRLPDGQMLRDGDGLSNVAEGSFNYWRNPLPMLLMYAYAEDPILKADYYRQGGPAGNPILFLLLNDPDLKQEKSLESLPLSKDFGPILGAMIARTGWNIGLDSNDVVAEIKGGGYHFGNHQHSDAGSLQVYYRGLQVADLGLYQFYGTPYDRNFTKRSVAHSMMLVMDPDEVIERADVNDGGTRYNQRNPRTPKQAQTDPWFNNGKVISADFGPSQQKPAFSYFKVDLAKAYSEKVSQYARGFCFLNLEREDVPAVIILTDDLTSQKAEFKKYWQVNTLFEPQINDAGFILNNQREKRVGNTHVQMLLPATADRELELLSGEKSTNVFGTQLDAPPSSRPEPKGHRIMISPKEPNRRDRFLTIFQMVDGNSQPLPVQFSELEENYIIGMANRVVSMSNSSALVQNQFNLTVPEGDQREVALLGLKPGVWTVRDSAGNVLVEAAVMAGKNTVYFQAQPGEYTITPQ